MRLVLRLTVYCILFVGITAVSPASESDELASITALRNQVSEQLKLAATAEEGRKQDQAIAGLCDLYVVLRSDPRYETHERLKGTAMKIRRRLLTVSNRVANQLEREGVQRPKGLKEKVDKAILRSTQQETETLLSSSAKGDVNDIVASGGAALGTNGGWQLVELIERVVSPTFWESQGGPGTVRYFAMQRVLVVRATSDVHQQLKDLLTALR